MGENAPAVLAPATRATRDATETFIAVQYGAGSDMCVSKQWNDTIRVCRQLKTSTDAGSSDGLTADDDA